MSKCHSDDAYMVGVLRQQRFLIRMIQASLTSSNVEDKDREAIKQLKRYIPKRVYAVMVVVYFYRIYRSASRDNGTLAKKTCETDNNRESRAVCPNSSPLTFKLRKLSIARA